MSSAYRSLHLAMWSGPRNISTAMMRAWGSRDDTFVCDEPLYAHYLKTTGKNHPGAADVIAHGETDIDKVTAWLTGPIPNGKRVFFQKHMSHHLLSGMERTWLSKLTHCFLIRHPREVLLSYSKIVTEPTLEDTGFLQQRDLFQWVRGIQGVVPAVLDARDVQNRPRESLGLLCDRIGVKFDERMLCWPKGLHPSDGPWAKYWYKEVENSTGFREYQEKKGSLPDALEPLCAECMRSYEELYAQRLH